MSIAGVAAPPCAFHPFRRMRRAAARGESRGVDTHRLSATLAVGAACVVLGACGGSDKPAYCSDVSDFKDAVSELTNVQIAQNGLSSLTAAVDKVKTSGKELV